MKLKHIAIVTSAVYSISKSIFARAVIGSPGVVADSTISTTVVCWVGTLVDILNKKRNLTEKRLIDMVWLQNFSLWHSASPWFVSILLPHVQIIQTWK